MIYGDGAFKDPVGKIWELADPVVGAGFTEGLNGLPNEVKLKYLAAMILLICPAKNWQTRSVSASKKKTLT